MCLAVPGKVTALGEGAVTVEIGDVALEVSDYLLPGLQCGDWVLVHAGFAMQTIDQQAAAAIQAAYRELAESADE